MEHNFIDIREQLKCQIELNKWQNKQFEFIVVLKESPVIKFGLIISVLNSVILHEIKKDKNSLLFFAC